MADTYRYNHFYPPYTDRHAGLIELIAMFLLTDSCAEEVRDRETAYRDCHYNMRLHSNA